MPGWTFVGGAVMYKTRQAGIQARLDRWKRRLAEWE